MKVILRKLEKKDASLMLEWMHDKDVVKFMKADFASKTIYDCDKFIDSARKEYDIIFSEGRSLNDLIGMSLHLAITDSSNEYLGTVSLKHIEKNAAEFGVTIRKCAMGSGIAILSMNEIIKIGFCDLGLNQIFWCVGSDNARALRFYDKNGFTRFLLSKDEADKLIKSQRYSKNEIDNFIWYQVKNLKKKAEKF